MADEDNKPHTALADAMEKAEQTRQEEYQSEGGELSRRKPGRPPKTTAGVNNTVDTYIPSPERNNRDQALQPTGDGAVAGDVEKTEPEQNNTASGGDYFPVLIKKGYRPLTDNWKIVKEDGSFGPKPTFDETESQKVKPGYRIGLPKEEARTIIRAGIAERADEL